MRPIRLAVISLAHAGAATALLAGPIAAHAEVQSRFAMDLPAQPLGDSIRALSVLSGRTILVEAPLLTGKQAPPLRGVYSVEEALSVLLGGTDLEFARVEDAYVIRRVVRPAFDAASPAEQAIVVTGTRIRGAPLASPLIALGREDMRSQGKSSLGDVVRSIPQSFGGGQNPGIGNNVPEARGVDVGGGSSINLRGLGSDATLTLFNGHRVAYTAATQSIDVSAVPFGAVDRIEIVPDGASALYGSDAVAGVANIILRNPFDGLETSVRLGATSDGGDFEQQYGAVGGKTWRSGGILAAYEYGSNSAIRAEQRSYASGVSPDLDLFPAMRHHNASLSGHQSLTETLIFAFDGLYNVRWSDTSFPVAPDGLATFSSKDRSFMVAPSFRLSLGRWITELSGTLGREKVNYHQVECHASCAPSGSGYYRNTERSIELSGNGPLFTLPGGPAKLAVGAGYRRIGFRRFNGPTSTVNTQHDQDSYYAFGEASLPLVGPGQGIPFVSRLSASAALRYERYPGVGGVATPKLGVVYAPTPDFDLRGSWGRSFRAPTLYQQYQPRGVYLFPALFFGGGAEPPRSAVLLIFGGNPSLKPERAETWSTTISLHPRALDGARLEVSYFNVAYRDRIVAPISFLSQALSNPIYADQITRAPSAAVQAEVIASGATFLNATSGPYDPSNVIAVIDDANLNAGRQSAHGFDIFAEYKIRLGDASQLSIRANASHLTSSQQLSKSQPVFPLAGIVFNPPRWRAQGSVGLIEGPLTLTATVNYIGGVRDTRFTPAVRVDSMAPVDLTLRYAVADGPRLLRGLDLSFSVQNVFNEGPGHVATTLPSDAPYDSTNYSPVGRLIAVGLTKRW
jgi:outer membrane receptor protein involved in Fe transport